MLLVLEATRRVAGWPMVHFEALRSGLKGLPRETLPLGMGIPTTANYIVQATMAAPALIKLGMAPISAHLFVFYFGILADIKPVALAVYTGLPSPGPTPGRRVLRRSSWALFHWDGRDHDFAYRIRKIKRMIMEVPSIVKMTKTRLVKNTAAKCGITREMARAVVNTVMAEIAATLGHGDKVALIGFGTWAVASRAERIGRHPRTGEPLKIPAHKVPVFRPGKGLKEKTL